MGRKVQKHGFEAFDGAVESLEFEMDVAEVARGGTSFDLACACDGIGRAKTRKRTNHLVGDGSNFRGVATQRGTVEGSALERMLVAKSLHEPLEDVTSSGDTGTERCDVDGRVRWRMARTARMLGMARQAVRRNPLERRTVEGLADDIVHADGEATTLLKRVPVRRQGDDGRVTVEGGIEGPNANGGFVTVHFGHLDVHEHQVEDLALDGHDGLTAVGHDAHAVALPMEECDTERLVDGVVFHEEHPERLYRSGRFGHGMGSTCRCNDGDGQGEKELRTLRRRRVDIERRAEVRREARRDREAEAKATMGAGGEGLPLLEGTKEMREEPWVDAHTRVGHVDAQRSRVARGFEGADGEHNATALGKLHRVRDEVPQEGT